MTQALHGLLNVHKPTGFTSMQVVERVRRWSGQRRVGHAGTLDPLASGVLPIGLGQGTRMLEFFDEVTKEYRATIELGTETATFDAEGPVVAQRDAAHVTLVQVEQALGQFRGVIHQRPPMYSALKVQGVPLYRLARRGIEVERPEREVVVHKLDLTDWSFPRFDLLVEVGRGLYLRALAHDLGQALGCGAYLQKLVRVRSGPFRIEESLPLETLETKLREEQGQEIICAMDEVVLSWPALLLNSAQMRALRKGQPLYLALDTPQGTRCRAYGLEGELLALLRYESGQGWRPFKSFAALSESPG